MFVVVGFEPVELVLVPDEGSVEELAADGFDPTFRERIGDRCPNGCLEDFESFGSEDFIERADELAAPVTNQGPRSGELVGVSQEQVAGCLGGPRSGRVAGRLGVEHLSGGDVDEEQDVDPFECGGVDGEEVTGDSGLGVKELCPGHVGSVRGRFDSAFFEDLPDGGGGECVAEAGEFAVDAAVAPGRVLGR